MKKDLRKQFLKNRRALSDKLWIEKSEKVLSHVQSLSLPSAANYVMIFMDFRKEVSTKPIIAWLWQSGYSVVIPRVKEGSAILELCVIDSFDDMELSPLGILEPKSDHKTLVEPAYIDFVFIPGVAFTKCGDRLGYGGGYYDQLIPQMKKQIPLVALAFDLQLTDSLPTESHDIRVHKIVTESGIIECH